MRIGVDIRTLSEGKTSGVEVYTTKLLQSLFALDKENSYILFSNSFKKKISLSKGFSFDNVVLKAFNYPNRILNVLLRYLNFPKLDRLVGGVDLFFSPRFLFSAFSKNCRLLVTAHDISFHHAPHLFSRRQRIWHWIIDDKKVFKRANAILAVSDHTKKDLVNFFGIQESKIFKVSPGVDHDQYSPVKKDSDQSFFSRHRLKEGYLLYLGTLEPRKNVESIIAAYEIFRSSKAGGPQLVIAGNRGWLYEKSIEMIHKSKYVRDIVELHSLSEDDKPALYRGAKLFLFPSFYEGFGFPPLEAEACGVPCVVSHNSSFPEVLGDSAVYVNPFRVSQIARAIDELYNDSEFYEQKRTQGITNARRFSWNKSAEEVLAVIQSLKKI